MSARSRKTYSFGPSMQKVILDAVRTSAVDPAQRSLIKSLFKKAEQNKIPQHIYELISCPVCDYDEQQDPPCSACGGRDRHPIPMTELYSLGRLIGSS